MHFEAHRIANDRSFFKGICEAIRILCFVVTRNFVANLSDSHRPRLAVARDDPFSRERDRRRFTACIRRVLAVPSGFYLIRIVASVISATKGLIAFVHHEPTAAATAIRFPFKAQDFARYCAFKLSVIAREEASHFSAVLHNGEGMGVLAVGGQNSHPLTIVRGWEFWPSEAVSQLPANEAGSGLYVFQVFVDA